MDRARHVCVCDGVLGRIALRFITLGGEFGDSLCCSAFSRFEVQAKKNARHGGILFIIKVKFLFVRLLRQSVQMGDTN